MKSLQDWLNNVQTLMCVQMEALEEVVEELCLECAPPNKSHRLERLRHFQADLRGFVGEWDWLADNELARYFHSPLYAHFDRFRDVLRARGRSKRFNDMLQERLAGSYQRAANLRLPEDNRVQLMWFLHAACEARYPRADPRLRVQISNLIWRRRRVITRQSSHLPPATLDFTRTIEFPPIPGMLAGKHFIRCPYCEHRFLRDLSQSKWRRHLIDDLRPYICMWALCPHTFGSIDAWLNHLKDADAHPTKLLPSFLNECPFCGIPCADSQWSSVEKLLRHIAEHHLEELFLLALPGGPTDLFSNVFLREEKISLEPYEAPEVPEAHEDYHRPFGSPEDDEVEESVDTEADDGLTSEGFRSPRSLI
ncbi:uncharacterized protein BO72DRAFT_497628 [Aspergillus fijiensis CBS 313.89]|uniref:C2H2-type domain-containing protein n=1 Tax=Aspergillus fijiensis CBS 313.89 TaxID=1448319 RepID=A0A8G1VX58_9EURO|nr:uncharacterized protein BO72DRAFT_497628 [Aspergillus fijiensis CBS 313.89]RAK75902.1 hypothetical protein BO72DRAFT_497628 [Aspergillus fijiensis CBS 313.89]